MRRAFVVFAFCLLLSSSVAWSQQASLGESGGLYSLPPFEDSVTYEVTGVVLNAWLRESKAQQTALKEALTKCDELEASLASAETLSSEALKAVNASLTSFETYRRSTSLELWLMRGGVAALVAYEVWRTTK